MKKKRKISNLMKLIGLTSIIFVLILQNICFAEKEDLTVGPGVVDMQIAGAPGTDYPQSVTSNGLMVTPNFNEPIKCTLKVTQSGPTVHYTFPKMTFNFLNDPTKDAFVNEQFNFLLNYNMQNVLSNNYKNNTYANGNFYNPGSLRTNWSMNKVGLKNFDGNVIELEFVSPEYKKDGMVTVKATYDIANNTLTLH